MSKKLMTNSVGFRLELIPPEPLSIDQNPPREQSIHNSISTLEPKQTFDLILAKEDDIIVKSDKYSA